MQPLEPSPSALMQDARISRPGALVLAAAFLLLIAVPGAIQTWRLPKVQTERFRSLLSGRPTGASLAWFEHELTRESSFAQGLRPLYQELAFRALRQGSHNVVVGHEGYLFLSFDVGLVTARGIFQRPHASPHPSLGLIQEYDNLLKARGIHLVVLPVPVAPAIYPDKAWPGYRKEYGPASNVANDRWVRTLLAAGVDVVDLAPVYWRERLAGPGPSFFLERNTHWTPHGVEVAARAAAAHVSQSLDGFSREAYGVRATTCEVKSDLVDELDLPRSMFAPLRNPLAQVTKGDKLATADDTAPVLLLGDSYSQIYGGEYSGGCQGGGLASRLMLELGVPVQDLTIAGANSTETRLKLADRPGALRGKRVLVWEFTTRYLVEQWEGAWGPAPLPLP